MKKLARYKIEILVGILLFFVGFTIAPTGGVDISHYANLTKENETNSKILDQKEIEIDSLTPKLEEAKSEVDKLNKELESKKQVAAN